ncbi:unnamed protein product [Sphagnum troendelagicum]|uniref:Uncharacterized protein n=1 Tax=Sphagnum jensenii TaxID=128206 RepID=A0ABP0VN19_9BRYO
MSGLDDLLGPKFPGPAPRQRNMGPSQARPQVGRGTVGATFRRRRKQLPYVMYKLPLTSTHVSKGISPLQKSICLLPITNKPSWTSTSPE